MLAKESLANNIGNIVRYGGSAALGGAIAYYRGRKNVRAAEKQVDLALSSGRHFVRQYANERDRANAAEATLGTVKAERDQLAELASKDGLTNLYNRRSFDDQAERLKAATIRHNRPVSLIMADVDHFKKVNDTRGHAGGDEVLKGVAGILSERARTEDYVARYGGEEFAILLDNTPIDAALGVANELCEKIKSSDLQVTASFGVTQFNPESTFAGDIMLADEALYRAKENGRNQVMAAETQPLREA